jgi:putative transposase
METNESLRPAKWEGKSHVVFIPKCRGKTLSRQPRRHLGEVFRNLAAPKESRIDEGRRIADHVPMMISIPRDYAVSRVIGSIWARAQSHAPARRRRGG